MKELYIEHGKSEGQEALYAYLQRPAASDKREDILDYERRTEIFQGFSQKHKNSKSKALSVKLKKLTYPMLYELLELENMTLYECYKIMYNIEIEWPYAEMHTVAGEFDVLPEERKLRFIQTAESLFSDFVIKVNESDLSPSEKLLKMTYQLYSLNDRKSAPLSYLASERAIRSNSLSVVPFKVFPEVAHHFRLPLHWLLCAEDKLTEFGNHPLTQRFMDCYMLLPPKTQAFLVSMVHYAFLAKEEGNG